MNLNACTVTSLRGDFGPAERAGVSHVALPLSLAL